ncbi:class I adenylate-forming enzyme family protein [Streptomyces griseus]|uniref:class I adenylate-forming enzyme family protein n=1 Tax=Streptomyces griseus TaxID=1911 RepID=UPI0005684AB2|nr:fatty acid--CoA ligase family protein [Streptomyces griseus]
MWEHVRRHASRTPAAPALIDPRTTLSWGELVRAVEHRCAGLPERPRRKPRLIALHRRADTAWVVDLLALRVKGYAVLAIPEAMPANPATALADELGAAGVLRGGPEVKFTEHEGADLGDTALVHLTSGTTGTARGVLRSAANLHDEASAVAHSLELDTAHAVLMGTPVTHSFASGLLFAALLAGAPSILVPHYDPAALAMLALRHRPGTIAGTPYVLRALAGTEAIRQAGLPGLRYPLCGGAPLHPSWADLWLRTTGVHICQEYGLSEGGIATMNLRDAAACPESVGVPVPRVDIRVLDADGRPAPAGTVGRIVVDRPANPTTYLSPGGRHRPIPAVDDGTAGGLDTGDLGFVDPQGLLHLTGRAKLLVNVAGAKVSPVEVEQRLLDHPAVLDAVVVGVADPDRGESVAAMVETTPGATIRELAGHLREHLSSFAVPRRWALTDTIPRTPAGKPDRARIRHLLEG